MIDLAPLPTAAAAACGASAPRAADADRRRLEPQAEPLPLPEPEVPKLDAEPGAASRSGLAGAAAAQTKAEGEARGAGRATAATPDLRRPPPLARPSRRPAPGAASSGKLGSGSSSKLAGATGSLDREVQALPAGCAGEQRQRGSGAISALQSTAKAGLHPREINKSSGFELLDDEVLALIQRAQPLPTPPPEIPGAVVDLVVPVAFSLKR